MKYDRNIKIRVLMIEKIELKNKNFLSVVLNILSTLAILNLKALIIQVQKCKPNNDMTDC